MAESTQAWTLGELADALGAELVGDPNVLISRPVPAHSDDPEGIAFAESERFLEAGLASGVGALIISRSMPVPSLKPVLRVDSPRMAFAWLLHQVRRPLALNEGIHPLAWVHAEASVDHSADVGPFAVVERGASIGPNCKVHAHAYIGEGCSLGNKCEIYPQAVLVQDVILGDRCVIFPGAVLGADGFGFAWDGQRRIKIPQVGRVVLEDDVEVGAGTCIDRATSGETRIRAGTKLDNLVQVGHNVTLGAHGVVAALTAFAGSSRVGDRAVIGGQSALKDGVTIGDDVVLAGRSGVMNNIDQPGEYFGLPAVRIREQLRQMAATQKLPELLKRVKQLEEEVKRLASQ